MTDEMKGNAERLLKAVGSATLERLNKCQTADYLGVTPRTLDRWYALREGPPRLKIGMKVYYLRESLDAWIKAQEETPVRSMRAA